MFINRIRVCLKSAALQGMILVAATLAGCGGGGGAENSTAPAPAPSAIKAASFSYANFKAIGLVPTTLPGGDDSYVRAWGDFRGTGQLDLFRAVLTYDNTKPLSQATPSRFEFWTHNADSSWTQNTALLPSGSNGCIHPRKAIIADFNGDSRPDIFVACHGYDAAPHPGETNKVVLSQPGGSYVINDVPAHSGFNHGATAADVNGDGRIDVILVDHFYVNRAYVLLGDGTGSFTQEVAARLPTTVTSGTGNWYSVDLVDVDGDGKLDLLMGGSEWENAPPTLFINPGNFNFTAVLGTVLPAVANQGLVLDFTVTGSGANRNIWLLRTSGGTSVPSYQSRVVQKVAYPSLTSTVVLSQQSAQWIPWLIPAAVNGAAAITSDNAAEAISLPQ